LAKKQPQNLLQAMKSKSTLTRPLKTATNLSDSAFRNPNEDGTKCSRMQTTQMMGKIPLPDHAVAFTDTQQGTLNMWNYAIGLSGAFIQNDNAMIYGFNKEARKVPREGIVILRGYRLDE
jgi:hypothetical protein